MVRQQRFRAAQHHARIGMSAARHLHMGTNGALSGNPLDSVTQIDAGSKAWKHGRR
jgi:hypothetical protein